MPSRAGPAARPGSGLSPPHFLQFHPLARLGPLAILHHDETSGPAHHAAVVAAVAVLEAPAGIPVLDGLDRLEQRIPGEVPARALQGLHEESGLLIPVEVGGV